MDENLDFCERCDHARHHHHPECVSWASIISMGGVCDCPEFIEQ